MEACLVKPEVKKKAQPPKPPPKPAKMKRINPERPDACLEPLQPADAVNVVSEQCERKASSSKTPTVPPRPKQKELTASTSQRRSGETDNTQAGGELSPDLETGQREELTAKHQNETNTETKQEELGVTSELSASADSLSEHNPEKGGLFDRMFRKSPKLRENAQAKEDQNPPRDKMSGSTDSLSERSKEKSGNVFSGLLKKTPKPSEETSDLSASNDDPTAGDDDPSEKNSTKVEEQKAAKPSA